MASRGFGVEDLAGEILTSMGFNIVEKRKRLKSGNIDIAEIDLLAEKDGDLYAVEVKAGRASTTDVRQAYSNAVLAGAKPLIVCGGFSDRAAEETARLLGVDALFMEDYFFASPEDISRVVEISLQKLLLDILSGDPSRMDEGDARILELLARSTTPEKFAHAVGCNIEEAGRIIASLRGKGIITAGRNFEMLRLQSIILLTQYRILKILNTLEARRASL